MPQCLAIDLVYHLFDVRLYIAVFVLFFLLFCAALCEKKRVHYIVVCDNLCVFITNSKARHTLPVFTGREHGRHEVAGVKNEDSCVSVTKQYNLVLAKGW